MLDYEKLIIYNTTCGSKRPWAIIHTNLKIDKKKELRVRNIKNTIKELKDKK